MLAAITLAGMKEPRLNQLLEYLPDVVDRLQHADGSRGILVDIQVPREFDWHGNVPEACDLFYWW